MYKSKEIRWFDETTKESILNWFTSKGVNFKDTNPRTDYYLPLSQENLTIKLREGNIEIKQRLEAPKVGRLTPTTEGIFEDWIKWSFNADKTTSFQRKLSRLKSTNG